MAERVEILIDVQHMKRIIKTIVCPVDYCTEDHKISHSNQYISHAGVVQWLDSLFTIGNEALKRASAACVMNNRSIVLEADVKAAMDTFSFDPKVPFSMQQTEEWGSDGMVENW